MTLAELLVAMTLIGVLGGSLFQVYSVGLNTFGRTEATNQTTQKLSVALDYMTKVLQSGYRRSGGSHVLAYQTIRTGDPEYETRGTQNGIEITFYSDLGVNDRPSLVHWYLDANNDLIEEITHADVTTATTEIPDFDTQPIKRRVLVSGLVAPKVGERALFAFFGSGSASRLNSDNTCKPLTFQQTTTVVAAQINLTALPTKNAFPVSMQNFVVLSEIESELLKSPNWSSQPSDTNPMATSDDSNPCGGMSTERTYMIPPGGGGTSMPNGPVAGMS